MSLLVKYKCPVCGFRSASPDILNTCSNCFHHGKATLLSPRMDLEIIAEAVIEDFKLSHNFEIVELGDVDEIEIYYGREKASIVREYLILNPPAN